MEPIRLLSHGRQRHPRLHCPNTRNTRRGSSAPFTALAIMHEKFCIVSDFPEILTNDNQNRPHNDHGPSHRWRDGFEIYHLDGVRLTKDLYWRIVRRTRTAADLAAIADVDQRTIAIKYGLPPAAFITQLNAELVHEGTPRCTVGSTREASNEQQPATRQTSRQSTASTALPISSRPGERNSFLHYTDPSTGKEHISFVTQLIAAHGLDADSAMAAKHGMTRDAYLAMTIEG